MMLVSGIGEGLLQAIVLLLASPLLFGVVNKTKAFLQKRCGASIWQAYFDIYKWWRKPVILTPYTSYIFIVAPAVYFATCVMAAVMVPGLIASGTFRFGDAFLFVYILALGRFFMTLASMDAATAFGGMGGSREIYLSVFIEPAILLAILVNAMRYGATTLSGMVIDYSTFYFTVPAVLTCVAFFLVLLAENGRIPVDNPDTHLELTMVHEGMTLEYSGRLLALIHLGSMLKLTVFVSVFSALYFPIDIPVPLKMLGTAGMIGIAETLNNKIRLFKVRVYLSAAIALLAVAIIAE